MPIEVVNNEQPEMNTKIKINDGKHVKEVNISEKNSSQLLNRSNISPKAELPQLSTLNDSAIVNQQLQNKTNLDLTLFSDTSFNVSPSGVSKQQKQDQERSSPSDMLWSQMKQQLSLREKLRGKKKELEDLIKNERYFLYEKLNKNEKQKEDPVEGEDEIDYNDEINEEIDDDDDDKYIYKITSTNNAEGDNDNQGKIYKTSTNTSSFQPIMYEKVKICSPDDLLMQSNSSSKLINNEHELPFLKHLNASAKSNSNLESSLVSSVIYNTNTINDLKKQLEDNNNTFECMLKNQTMLSSLLEKNLNALNSNSSSFQQQQQQQPSNVYLAQSTAPYYTPQPHQPIQINDPYMSHYNNQMQMQQMMANLNAAYREIGQQRSEINNLTQKIDDINRHLSSPALCSSHDTSFLLNQNEVSTKKHQEQQKQQQEMKKRSMESTYLNNYLNTKSSVKSSDSSFILGNDDKNLKIENLKNLYNKKNYKTSRSSTSTSTTSSTKQNTSSTLNSTLNKTHSTSNASTARNSPEIAKTKNIKNNKKSTSSTALTANALPTATTITNFDELRETIYSEVATLISQNETRPQYLLNLFRELQHLKSKNSRDQALKSIFNISSRHSTLTDVTAASSKNGENVEGNLDDTVVYLKSRFDYSTDENSSITSDNKISIHVKQLINKVLKTINYDKNNDCMLTIEYLNELINKIIAVIKQKKDNRDYLRLYQSQLVSYLKEALHKYESLYLNKNINKILFDVSDILFNELTFYSIMNNSNSSFQKRIQPLQQNEADKNLVKQVASLAASSSNNIQFVKSSPSLSSSLSSSKKKNSTFSLVTKESILMHHNSSSSETDQNTKTNNNYDDEFEEDDDDAADADDDNEYEGVTADDGDYNVDNSEEEEDNDNDNDDDDNDEEDGDDDDDNDEESAGEDYKKFLYNIGDGSSIRRHLGNYQILNGFFDLNSYEKYKMIDPHGAISSGAGPVQSLNLMTNHEDYSKFFRSTNDSNNITNNGNSHFIELAQSELKPYSRIGSDEDENEQDDDDEQFSDNLETAVSRQPDIAVVQEQKQHKEEPINTSANLEDKEIELTIDDIPDKFNFKSDEVKNLIFIKLSRNHVTNTDMREAVLFF